MMADVVTTVALVTGASRGIGRETALALGAKGLAVYLAAEGAEAELQEGEAAARAAGAPEAAHGLFDLAQAGEAERMVEAALERFGRVDVLVNNAGIRCRKAFGDYTPEDFDRVVGVNLAAAFFASQAVLPAMRRQGGGRIVHVASQLGRVAASRAALYSMTKGALIQLTRSMAYELAKDGILVNSISPGPIATQINLDYWRESPEAGRELLSRVPLGRAGTPAEIAEAIAFLATSRGRFITGHDLVVDGGYVIN